MRLKRPERILRDRANWRNSPRRDSFQHLTNSITISWRRNFWSLPSQTLCAKRSSITLERLATFMARLNKRQQAYYPLLWSLSAVRICPTHKKPLVDTCSQCHRAHYPLARRPQIGFCPWCGSWLPGKDVATQPEPDRKLRLTRWEIFSAESAAALIGDVSNATLNTGNSQSYFKDNILNLVEKLFAGSENAMADYTGTHRVSVCNWSNGKQMPSLRAVFDSRLMV